MPDKSSSTGKRNYPGIPPSHSGIQVNHCKSPICTNYGVAPEQKSVRGKNRYTLDRHKGIASCICTVCGVGFPLKSNLGIVEEIERLASCLSPPDTVCCPNNPCLPAAIDDTYATALTRDDIESPDAPSSIKRLPEYGMQIHGEHTMYGHFFFLKRLLGNVQKWRFFIDQDPGLRAACLAAFHDEIRAHTVDVFYVRINKELTVDERRHRYNDAKTVFEQAKASHPDMKPQDVKRELIKERLAAMTVHGKWQDQWLEHPFSTMGEPEKAVACLTDLSGCNEEHKAWLYNKASLQGVDSFFNQVRRRLSLPERPIHSRSNKGRI